MPTTAADDPLCPGDAAALLAPKPVVLVVAVALVDADGRVLLTQRPPGKKLAGMWEFPGGKVEPNETPEAALLRELREELDLDISAACLAPYTFASHAYDDFHLLMPLHFCRPWADQPPPREDQSIEWGDRKGGVWG